MAKRARRSFATPEELFAAFDAMTPADKEEFLGRMSKEDFRRSLHYQSLLTVAKVAASVIRIKSNAIDDPLLEIVFYLCGRVANLIDLYKRTNPGRPKKNAILNAGVWHLRDLGRTPAQIRKDLIAMRPNDPNWNLRASQIRDIHRSESESKLVNRDAFREALNEFMMEEGYEPLKRKLSMRGVGF